MNYVTTVINTWNQRKGEKKLAQEVVPLESRLSTEFRIVSNTNQLDLRQLQDQGYVIINNLLGSEKAKLAFYELSSLHSSGEMTPARVLTHEDLIKENQPIRGDVRAWMTNWSCAEFQKYPTLLDLK